MSNLLKSAIILAFPFAISVAKADILLEPFVNYDIGEYDNATKAYDAAGATYGARLGYDILGLAFGVQYNTGTVVIDYTTEKDHKLNHLGVFVKFEFPILIHVWGTYFFQTSDTSINVDVDPDGAGPASSSNGDAKFEGTGTEIGIGYTIVPFVKLNLSMTNIKYEKVEHSAFTGKRNSDETYTAYRLGISIPITL